MDKFLVFDWKGYFAHFRQFESNSSSLSYTFPPPTVVYGMLAGLIGIEKDQYYDQLNPDHIRVGIQIVGNTKKIIQTCNYIFAKSPGDLNMSGENMHTQIPVEFVVSSQFPRQVLNYRIFLKIYNNELFNSLYNAISKNSYQYLPYFGSAPLTSWIEWPGDFNVIEQQSDMATVDTAVNLNLITKKNTSLEVIDGKSPAFFIEHMRYFFKENREPGSIVDVLWEKNRQKIKATFSEPVYQFKNNNNQINVSFI